MISGGDANGRAPWLAPFGWLVAGLFLLAGSLWWSYRWILSDGEVQIPLIASGILIVWVGLALNVVLKRLRADPAVLTVTPDSVRPGDEITAVYRQRFRRPATVTEAVIRLVRAEEAVKGSGKSRTTHTDRLVVQESKQTDRAFGPDDELVLSINARIPADAMHSFEFGHNELTWKVEAAVAIKGWPDESDHESIEVRPERPA